MRREKPPWAAFVTPADSECSHAQEGEARREADPQVEPRDKEEAVL